RTNTSQRPTAGQSQNENAAYWQIDRLGRTVFARKIPAQAPGTFRLGTGGLPGAGARPVACFKPLLPGQASFAHPFLWLSVARLPPYYPESRDCTLAVVLLVRAAGAV